MMTDHDVHALAMHGLGIEKYVDDAIRFNPAPLAGAHRRALRVATTLITCSTAAAILNEMKVGAEGDAVYRHINVHNPRCPLVFGRRWSSRCGFENHPLFGVNWAGAQLMCRYLGGRLPKAWEWDCFASNNDPKRKYPWGHAEPSHLLANFGEHYGGVSRVGSFPASEIGLYDLAGNLGEWCEDACGSDDASEHGAVERVVKGGAWSKDAHHLEIAMSRGKWERLGTTTIGFRPVWDT